jgi:hypothetical protein
MHEHREPEQRPAEPEDYVTPALTDLGSFEEITKLNPQGPSPDSEGFSTGPQ